MGLIDDIVNAFVDLIEFFDFNVGEISRSFERAEDPTEALALVLQTVQPVDEVGDILVDLSEEFVLAPITEEGELTPENVESVQDEIEGNAAAITAGILAVTLSIETLTGGQVDEIPSEIFQAVTALGFTDVAGREIDARLQEGIDPALKQKIHREARSKQADFQDFADANVRSKRYGGQIPTLSSDIPDEVKELLHPDDFGWLADPDTYGTVPAQNELFELVSLGVSEPEEIIEEPIQYGIPVPLRPVEALNDLQGFPEDVKSIYRSVIEALPRTENLIQDYARLAEFNFRLREKVQSGALTPVQARKLIEPELRDVIQDALPADRYREEDRDAEETVDILADELERNFKLLGDLPPEPPTNSQLESWFQKGVISGQTYADLYDKFGSRSTDFAKYITEAAVDAGWERIQQQHALGRISTSDAVTRLQLIGYNQAEAERILAGGNGNDVWKQRLQGEENVGSVPPSALPNIGDSRQAALRLANVTTVAEVAQLSPDELVSLTGVSDQEATEALSIAQASLQ